MFFQWGRSPVKSLRGLLCDEECKAIQHPMACCSLGDELLLFQSHNRSKAAFLDAHHGQHYLRYDLLFFFLDALLPIVLLMLCDSAQMLASCYIRHEQQHDGELIHEAGHKSGFALSFPAYAC